MSDQEDRAVANEDTKGTAPEISQQQSPETQEGNSLAGDALVDAVLKDHDAYETLRRKLQSDKDKGVSEALKEIEELKKRISPEPVAEQTKVEAQPTASSVDIEAIKRAYPDIKLDAPDVLPRIASKMNDVAALMTEMGRIHQERQGKPKPTSASVTPPAGRTQASASIDDLQAEYNALLSDPVSFVKPENRARRAEIIKRMEELENV